MTTAPKKAHFNVIIENDGYKFVPANKTAEKFCKSYGAEKIRQSEAIAIGINYDNIKWNTWNAEWQKWKAGA